MTETKVTIPEMKFGYYYYYQAQPLGFYVSSILIGENNYLRFSRDNPRIPGKHKYDHKLLPVDAKLSQFEPGTDSEGHSEGDAAGYLGGRKSKKTRKTRKKKLRRNKKRSNTKRRR
jgi:hypothetical protein